MFNWQRFICTEVISYKIHTLPMGGMGFPILGFPNPAFLILGLPIQGLLLPGFPVWGFPIPNISKEIAPCDNSDESNI